MQPVIQCVPNFSEGRDESVVHRIVDAARNASSVRVIDYSSDPDHNRMVLTMLGSPDELFASVTAAAGCALAHIDLRTHTGVHPRVGAVDVVPFVPVQGIDISTCIELSHRVGREFACRFNLPVYFYAESAGDHVILPEIRRGGFERLACGIGGRLPDVGPHRVHPTGGVAVVGARGPLVAFNVILASADLAAAKSIAKKLRTGEAGLPGVKSIGVPLESRGQVQVSVNITRPDLVSITDLFRFVECEAGTLGIDVAESEIIGALRRQFFGEATPEEIRALHFSEKQIIDSWLEQGKA